MDNEGDSYIRDLDIHPWENEKIACEMGKRVDEFISYLGNQIIQRNCRINNVEQTLHQILHFRTAELQNEKTISDDLLLLCKFLIFNITSCSVKLNTYEEQNNVFRMSILKLSFEILIVAGKDDTCCDYIQSFLDSIKTEDYSSQFKINQILSAFECLLDALIFVGVKPRTNLPKTLDLLANVNFVLVLKDFVTNCDNHNLSSVVLCTLVPKLIHVTSVHPVIDMFWVDIKSTSISFPVKLFVLCGLADFLPSKTENLSIIETNSFWKLVQEGLVSADSLLRKQALYLLKRAIDYLVRLNISLNVGIFSWNSINSCKLQQTWEKMFILLEVLEEKQAHLVIPAIQSVLKSTDLISTIGPFWVVVAYVRMLSHDSLQVVKLGVTHFLEMRIEFLIDLGSQCRFIIEILFQKLNNMLLYYNHSNNVDWSSTDILLRKWFASITTHSKLSEELLPAMIEAMTKVQWCTIPLFHVLFNLSLAPAVEIFSDSDLIVLSGFLKEAIKTQNVFIRGAVQCVILNVIVKGTRKSANVNDIVSTLSVFRQTECFKRGLKSWDISKEWISSFTLEEGKIIKLLFVEETSLTIEAKARSLVLFIDSGLINPSGKLFQEALKEYFCVLEDTHKRPYASLEESDRCLKWILHILDNLESDSVELFSKKDSLIGSISPYINEAVSYIQKRLFELDQLENFENIEIYASVLQTVSDMGLIHFEVATNLNKISIELNSSPNCHPVQRLLALKIILWFIRFGAVQKGSVFAFKLIKDHCLFILKNGHLQLIIPKSESDTSLARNHQVHWGWLLSGYTCALWSFLQECLDKNITGIEDMLGLMSAEEIIQHAINSIESGGRESLLPVLKVLKYVFPKVTSYSLCQRFLKFSWKSCFELRKIALFWPTIKSWIELTFSKKAISNGDLRGTIYDFSEEILREGETVNGLSNVLLKHLRQELTDVSVVEPLLSFLIKAMVFGLVPRKDQRIESDTYTLIGSLGSDLAVNDLIPHPGYGSSHEVRLCALSVLLGVADQDGGTQLIVSAIKQLMELDNQLSAKRQRYHGDSLHHRIKHRVLQAVMVLHQVIAGSSSPLAKSCQVELVKWSSVGLQGESQQPSVRYQLEWLLVRTLLQSPDLLTSFWALFNESSEERTGSVCSFISVAYHLADALRDAEFTDRCVAEILPWCMAQQFNIRLYAQVVLDKLWPLDANVAAKYEVVRKSLSRSLSQGNTMRNVDKLKNDFYFTAFHPLRHYTLETIFYELPRLSNIARDEWAPLSTIKDSLTNYDTFLPLLNPDDSLKQFVPPSWVVKATAEAQVEVEALTMQKKFVPWKSMFPELEPSPARTGLIVVASLIDKLPNLGGLTRTCEIFAAECLVVPSLEFTKDRMFSTLSMTAEKHINIIEVKPFDLPKYLREKKTSGYTLVGAEQTASSVSLESFKFPKKCVLLLGNEKEGVPVNLLPLLDVCVEVPQLGVVRSLNVHVTGALFVWEYTKQHLELSSARGAAS